MKQMLAVFLIMGLLIGCETTARHVSTMTSEETVAGEMIPPIVVEEEVLEPEVEEIDIVPSTEEKVAQAVESPNEVPHEMSKEPVPVDQKPVKEEKKAPLSTPSGPQIPPASVSVEPPKTNVAEPVQPKKFHDIYFDFDQAVILDADRPVLEANGGLLKGHFKHLNVLIEGHCDERGSVEYNLVLGVRRAQVVKAYLIDLGIPASRIRIVSYGKERPVCTQQNETCWQKNRRAHFVLQ